MTSVLSATREHSEVWRLLPWYVNHSLDEDERVRVRRHVVACTECQEEVGFLRTLASGIEDLELPRPPTTDDPGEVLGAVWRRIETLSDGGPSGSGTTATTRGEPRARLARRGRRLTLWAVAAQLVLVIGVVLIARSVAVSREPAAYHTLSRPRPAIPGAAPRVRVVFRPGATEAELREIVTSTGASIVDGPSPFGVYTLAPRDAAATDPAEMLRALRERSEVAFAEPVGRNAEAEATP